MHMHTVTIHHKVHILTFRLSALEIEMRIQIQLIREAFFSFSLSLSLSNKDRFETTHLRFTHQPIESNPSQQKQQQHSFALATSVGCGCYLRGAEIYTHFEPKKKWQIVALSTVNNDLIIVDSLKSLVEIAYRPHSMAINRAKW